MAPTTNATCPPLPFPPHPAAPGIDDLIALDVLPREYLLAPIIPIRGLAMIHARRGGSKTFLTLSIGLGGRLRNEVVVLWPYKVLLVDCDVYVYATEYGLVRCSQLCRVPRQHILKQPARPRIQKRYRSRLVLLKFRRVECCPF